ncbi:MAG: pantetheine-phosphate adenylyltransferase, partial [Pseudonocardiaceae bacterium]
LRQNRGGHASPRVLPAPGGERQVRPAVFPGSFDPVHNGHLEVAETAARLFDRVLVAPVNNPQKGEPFFALADRQEMIAHSLDHLSNVIVQSFSSLVVDLVRSVRADVIVKGLRVASDAESELQQAHMNKSVAAVETLFIPCSSEYTFVASRYLREFARYGGADRIGTMVPGPVFTKLKEKFAP